MATQIGLDELKLQERVEQLEEEMASNAQRVEYLVNSVDQFIENGYEISEESIRLEAWSTDSKNLKKVYEHKIYFKRDYSSRPQVFFTVNKVKNFYINSAPTDGQKKVSVVVSLQQLMTSYFTVRVEVKYDESFRGQNEQAKVASVTPEISLTYIALDRKSVV